MSLLKKARDAKIAISKSSLECTKSINSSANFFCKILAPLSILCSVIKFSIVSWSKNVKILMYFSASASVAFNQNW